MKLPIWMPALVVAVLAIGGVVFAQTQTTPATPNVPALAPTPAVVTAAPAPGPPPVERQVPESRTAVQLSFAPIVQKVVPSVVNVYATRVEQVSASPFANDPFFSRFFGNSLETRPQESQSLGSGVVVEASGVILTNSHVVSGASDIRVSMQDGREYGVDLVLDDTQSDLAVLKIRDPAGRTFPAIAFADSDALQVGDLVLAIGNPFGVGQTVTSGIVSAVARTGVESTDYQFFIQTDAAINPGNSGGALVDLDGRLVGINTAIFSQSGGSVGIGFAIPANMARVVADAGIAGGKLERAWVGARLQALDANLAASLGIDPPRGALVADVAPDGPAMLAGLKAGDVITAIGDTPVADPQEFTYRVATQPVGGTVTLGYIRSGKPGVAQLTLAAATAVEGPVVTITGNTRFAGASGAQLTPAFADDLGLPYDAAGIVISAVEPSSPADQLGLKRGDILLNLQGRDVQTVDDFQKMTAGRPEAWRVTLQRGGQTIRSTVGG
jgi:serine protease Do